VEPAATSAPWFARYSLRGVTAVFLVLVVCNTMFGVKEQRTGYPFTCYPPFSRDPGPVAAVIHIEPSDAAGNPLEWDEAALKKRFGSARYVSLIRQLKGNPDPQKLHAFWELVAAHNPQVKEAQTVRFWETTLLTDPDLPGDRAKRVVSRDLVYTYTEGEPGPDSVKPLPRETVTSTDDASEEDPDTVE
jgi:hypothetical protein